jgi:DNA polymerase elongation subunit (family B)
MFDFKVIACDTDSIFFTKPDNSSFNEEESKELLNKLNSLYPDLIKWELNGLFSTVITLKAKNYILWDGKKLKTKGSALKSSTKELALKELINEIIWCIINEKYNYLEIYNSYIKKAMNITTKEEMKKWSSKRTLTDKVLKNERTNEKKVRDALGENHGLQEGDKIWVFFKTDKSLCLVENFTGDYDKFKLMEKIWDTMQVFANILDIKQFPKYHLKKQRSLVELL